MSLSSNHRVKTGPGMTVPLMLAINRQSRLNL
jgi:hypothetical protein